MTATDHAAAVNAIAAGVMGSFVAAIGLTDTELIASAFCACVLGSLRSPPVPRWRGVLMFFCAVYITAKIAQTTSPAMAVWMPVLSLMNWRTIIAILCGTMLYPVLQALWDATPAIVAKLAKRRTDGGSA